MGQAKAATAFLCEGNACRAPLAKPEELIIKLRRAVKFTFRFRLRQGKVGWFVKVKVKEKLKAEIGKRKKVRGLGFSDGGSVEVLK